MSRLATPKRNRDGFGDLSGYTGCWKLEGEPFYFVISESFE
ncbi:MAG: hypothetical protein ACLU3F_15585 [Blautia wexlerae]